MGERSRETIYLGYTVIREASTILVADGEVVSGCAWFSGSWPKENGPALGEELRNIAAAQAFELTPHAGSVEHRNLKIFSGDFLTGDLLQGG